MQLAAAKHFSGSLRGTLNVTGRSRRHGGRQPLAITMNEGVALVAEVEEWRIDKRLETRYLDIKIRDIDEAVDRALEARSRDRSCPSACFVMLSTCSNG